VIIRIPRRALAVLAMAASLALAAPAVAHASTAAAQKPAGLVTVSTGQLRLYGSSEWCLGYKNPGLKAFAYGVQCDSTEYHTEWTVTYGAGRGSISPAGHGGSCLTYGQSHYVVLQSCKKVNGKDIFGLTIHLHGAEEWFIASPDGLLSLPLPVNEGKPAKWASEDGRHAVGWLLPLPLVV
jgi:hypothetical protein